MNIALEWCEGLRERIEIIISVACLLSDKVVWCWRAEWILLRVLLVLNWSLVVEIILSRCSVVKIWSGLISVWILEHWLI